MVSSASRVESSAFDQMTDLVKPSVIFVRLCGVQQRPKFAHFGLPCGVCRKFHARDLWLCFYMICILSSSACATAAPSNTVLKELQLWLKKIHPSLEKSDASLYAPTLNEIPENCKEMSLMCYACELEVVIIEEELYAEADHIYHLKENLRSQGSSVSCPPCEAQTLEPIAKFLKNLEELLQQMYTQQAGV